MKKEKKVKLYFTESDSRKVKTYATTNKIPFWNGTNHFQFDLATAVITLIALGVVIVLLAALNPAVAAGVGLAV